MIILDEFVDVIKVIRIKVVALYAKMPLDRFGKELCFVSVSLASKPTPLLFKPEEKEGIWNFRPKGDGRSGL